MHLGIARKHGASDEEIGSLFAFLAPYLGFPKAFNLFPSLKTYRCEDIVRKTQCKDCETEYPAIEPMDDSELVHSVTAKFMEEYGKLFSPLAVRAFTTVWLLPTLTLKAKLFALLTTEIGSRSLPLSLVDLHISHLIEKGVVTKIELEDFFDFAGFYIGYPATLAFKTQLKSIQNDFSSSDNGCH